MIKHMPEPEGVSSRAALGADQVLADQLAEARHDVTSLAIGELLDRCRIEGTADHGCDPQDRTFGSGESIQPRRQQHLHARRQRRPE